MNFVSEEHIKMMIQKKMNIGFDYAFLGGMFAGSFDWFRDDRYDIFIYGTDRSVPAYYGAAKTPDVNKGKIKNSGFELEVRFNKVLNNSMRFWVNANYTYAHNEIILKDDPELIPSYRKAQGYSQGQYVSYIDNGFINTYDELYSTPEHQSNDAQVLIGDHYIVDFNGDGVVDQTNDQAPYGYTGTPEHTYNATIGWEWKGWIKKLGFSSLKIYLNGNNLLLITKMPDDRESNYGWSGGGGAYPTVRRYNLGFKLYI